MSILEKVDACNLDESLNKFNAVIEEETGDDNVIKYYLKIRFAPFPELHTFAQTENLLCFTDTFYDVSANQNTKSKPNPIFHLSRRNKKTGKNDWFRQEGRNLNERSHLCASRVLNKNEILNVLKTMEIFLEYDFQRYYFQQDSEGRFSLYLDLIKEPFEYSVVTCKIRIDEDIGALTENKIRSLVSTHCPSIGLPIYSKFAYMLQISELFELQEAIFPDDDPIYDRMQKEIEQDDYRNHQAYLWNFERIVQFQNIYCIVQNKQETINRVKALEDQFKRGIFEVNVSIDPKIEDLL